MTNVDPQSAPEPPEEAAKSGTLIASIALKQRAGGIIVPVLTALIAFSIGGLVVLATGHNPFSAYNDIFDGSGLNWFAHPTTNIINTSAYNLSQTLLQTTTLVLCGLAVAFAFRCGMFNIGGQGQYFVGLYVANWLGHDFASMNTVLHIILCIAAATFAGAVWAGIAGFLKATVGAHEVISTIMLNWIAIWIGEWLFGDGGPLQNPANATAPISNDIAPSAQIGAFWGTAGLQALDYGFFVAIAGLIVYYVILNRTTVGYEVRAVGFNPEAAAYGGINVRKNLIRAMGISGAFAGLAGAIDMLGYLSHYGQSDIPVSSVGFLGIAVALLGRNTAIGVGLGGLLFGALLFGTTHGLQSGSSSIDPSLAGNLTYIIQGLIVLFVGADVLILYVWNSRKKLRRKAEATA
ncbi:MAG TPA: ABC transporter permease [Gaiellaceae bacterium]|jgi:simple sugar transport system permease protein